MLSIRAEPGVPACVVQSYTTHSGEVVSLTGTGTLYIRDRAALRRLLRRCTHVSIACAVKDASHFAAGSSARWWHSLESSAKGVPRGFALLKFFRRGLGASGTGPKEMGHQSATER